MAKTKSKSHCCCQEVEQWWHRHNRILDTGNLYNVASCIDGSLTLAGLGNVR